MKKICELKINVYDERKKVCIILAENGYSVRIESREAKENYNWAAKDYWIIVHEQEREEIT